MMRSDVISKVLGTFENGRVEAFIRMRPLEPEDMRRPELAARIARRLAQFHAVPIREPRESKLFATIREWCGLAWRCCTT